MRIYKPVFHISKNFCFHLSTYKINVSALFWHVVVLYCWSDHTREWESESESESDCGLGAGFLHFIKNRFCWLQCCQSAILSPTPKFRRFPIPRSPHLLEPAVSNLILHLSESEAWLRNPMGLTPRLCSSTTATSIASPTSVTNSPTLPEKLFATTSGRNSTFLTKMISVRSRLLLEFRFQAFF